MIPMRPLQLSSLARFCCFLSVVLYAQSMAGETTKQRTAVVVGGGPAGLSTALVLSRAPHNFDVTVVESSSEDFTRKFDASKAYLYLVNQRGQKLTTKFASLHDRLKKRSVEQTVRFGMNKSTLVPSDLKAFVNTTVTTLSPNLKPKPNFWIPRHDMVDILMDTINDKGMGDGNRIDVLFRTQFTSMESVINEKGDSKVIVKAEDKSGKEINLSADLVVGADGINSNVRNFLNSNPSAFQSWKYNAKTFKAKQKNSPASGLRLKALQLPPDFKIIDGDGSLVDSEHDSSYAIRSREKGPTSYLSLGLLPMSRSKNKRPANFITRPNHELWNIKNGKEMREYCINAFPKMRFDTDVVPAEEWERFAGSEGTRFPPVTYCKGLQISSPDEKAGVALVGDAIHAFPPDIGQGVNAAYEDVVALDHALQESSCSEKSVGSSLKDYEKDRAAEAKAIFRLALIGAPYQYRQPLYRDKIGRYLWQLNATVRIILNKLSFGLTPPPAIMLGFEPSLKFSKIMFRADMLTAALTACLSFILLKVII